MALDTEADIAFLLREAREAAAREGTGEEDRVWEQDATAEGDAAPWIKPGDQYVARVIKAVVVNLRKFETRRLVLTMRIVEGAEADTRLEFWTPFPRVVGPKAKYRRAWEIAHGAPSRRKDRLPLKIFRNRLFRVLVEDVTTDRYQRPLARPYSVIAAILERLA
jgi:hypothetical protein